jgi:SAM-dependent methyltransferase
MTLSPQPMGFSPAAERNRLPLLDVLRELFTASGTVLEIGSGTGQHAVFFAEQLPWLRWQPTEMAEQLPALRARTESAGLPNLLPPLELDALRPWPIERADGVFSANTAHIMAWPAVEAMFKGAADILAPGGLFALYGPFNYRGAYTSESNRQFDAMLRARDAGMAIRDFEAVEGLAQGCGFETVADRAMPANNRTLIWRRG